jgi:hypothetical protein
MATNTERAILAGGNWLAGPGYCNEASAGDAVG